MYCDNGNLVDKCSSCGCPNINDICVENLGCSIKSCLFGANCTYLSEEWNISEIENIRVQYTSIALDFNNHIHISYRDDINLDLKYAKWNGYNWNIQVVDESGNSGYSSSISIDNKNNPHISYWKKMDKYGDKKLMYAKWNGSNWNIEEITSGVEFLTSIALDKNDNPYIGFYSTNKSHFGYATFTGLNWSINFPSNFSPNMNAPGKYLDIYLDSINNLNIAYSDGHTGGKLYYWVSSKNKSIIVDGDNVKDVSIIVDSKNNPHIAYSGGGNLKYATFNGTHWDSLRVDSEIGRGGLWPSIGLDNNNYPHITHSNSLSGYLKYVRWTGVNWNIGILDNKCDHTDICSFSSLVIDKNNKAYVSYLGSNYSFKYANNII